jgi:excisionase family DNA binding protein
MESMEVINRDALRIEEVAEKLNCSRRFLGQQIALGRLPVIRLSRRCVRVRPADLDDYLARHVARA